MKKLLLMALLGCSALYAGAQTTTVITHLFNGSGPGCCPPVTSIKLLTYQCVVMGSTLVAVHGPDVNVPIPMCPSTVTEPPPPPGFFYYGADVELCPAFSGKHIGILPSCATPAFDPLLIGNNETCGDGCQYGASWNDIGSTANLTID